ncbi:MAG: hypothetical protein DRP00_03785, partial [Candidatus Aenigmatarchaeota archaeon]
MSQKAQRDIQGIVTEVLSVDKIKAIIFSSGSQPLVGKRMPLKVVDEQSNSEFLVEVTDVKPRDPTLDYVDFNELVNKVPQVGITPIKDAIKAVRERIIGRFRPNWEVTCRVLGKITKDTKGKKTQIKLEPSFFPVTPYSIVERLSDEELDSILKPKGRSVYLGKHALYRGLQVILDHRKFDHHLAILSQTGGGKTETAKRIAFELHKNNVPILIIDPAGQYSGLRPASGERISLLEKIVEEATYKAEAEGNPNLSSYLKVTLLVPPACIERKKNVPLASLLDRLNQLTPKCDLFGESYVYVIKNFGSNGVKKVSRVNPSEGEIKYETVDKEEPSKIIRDAPILIVALRIPCQLRATIIDRLRRGVSRYFDIIIRDAARILEEKKKDGSVISERNGVQYYDILKIREEFPSEELRSHYHTASIEAASRELRIISCQIDKDFDADKTQLLIERILEKGSITIYDYLISNREEGLIITWLLNEIYEKCNDEFLMEEELDYWPRIVAFLEEAHRLAPSEQNEAELSYSLTTVRKIATEGRKLGFGLCLISQRPARLDSTTLSQASTLIALRVRNPVDQRYIRDSCEAVLEEDINLLPELGVGEAIVSGVSVPEPRIPI